MRHRGLTLTTVLLGIHVATVASFSPTCFNGRSVLRLAKTKGRQQSQSSATTFQLLGGIFSATREPVSSTKARVPARKQPFPKVSVPKDFNLPDPKPLTVTRREKLPDLIQSSIALAVRLATGVFVLGWKIETIFAPEDGKYALTLGPFRIRDASSVLSNTTLRSTPEDPCLVLYEYEASPYCKRVRETINLLDLTVEYRPCPGARAGFSDELFELTGRRTVPFLLDTRSGKQMFESSDIIQYLLKEYGPPKESYDSKALWPITWESFSINTATIVALLRGMPGSMLQSNARSDNIYMRPLELWGYECSPFVRPVREKLCSLGLAHTMISTSRGSSNRDKLLAKSGQTTFQVPFLVDPNTGVKLFESYDIVDYLESVYTV